MAENAGTIFYEVDARTDGLISAEKQVVKTTASMNAEFAKTDKAVKSANVTMGNFGRKAGMAGVQIEQLVGQIQNGGNAAQAFAFQAADLGFVLGFPLAGAIAGITASLAGPFINSIIGADEETQKFNSTIDETISNLKSVRLEVVTGSIETLTATIRENANEIERLQNIPDKIGGRAVTGLQRRRKEQENLEKITELEKEQIRNNEALAVLEQRRLDIQNEGETVLGADAGADPEGERLAQLYMNRSALEQQAEQDRQRADAARTKAEQDEINKRLRARQMEVSAYAQLGSQLTNLVSVVGAEQSALGKAIFLANQALAVANIIVSTQQAAAQALTLDPTGTLSARVTALGYASAGIAAGVGVAQTFTGRQTGGPVSAGTPYRVNETGPELFTSGGRQYLIPDQNGNVSNSSQAASGTNMPQVNVVVNNNAQASVNVSQSVNDNVLTVDMLITDIAEGGRVSRTLEGSYTLPRRTS